MKSIVIPAVFNNFLLLHVAIQILTTPELCRQKNTFAKDLLREYVKHAKQLYGNEFMSYNVHCLLRLADDAFRYVYLDWISAFPFQNHL